MALLNLTLGAVGLSLLYGLGIVRSLRAVPWNLGLALFVGWAAVGIVTSLFLVGGAAATIAEILALSAAIVGAALLVARRVADLPPPSMPAESGSTAKVAVVLGSSTLVITLAALFRRAQLSEPVLWDAWWFWVPKATSIVHFDGLAGAPQGFTSFANPDYPPFAPAVDAVALRFMGTTEPGDLALQRWIVAAAFVGSIAALLARRVRPAFLWPSLAVVVLLPGYRYLVGSMLGDEPLVLLFSAAGVSSALWLLDREPAFAALTGLFLTAAALAKNEGFALALLLVLAVAVSAQRGRGRWPVLLLALGPLSAFALWRAWLHDHVSSYVTVFRPSDLLRPDDLMLRLDRLWTSLYELAAQLLAFEQWLLTLPLVVGVSVLLARQRSPLATLVLGTLCLGYLALAAVYWASSYPVPLETLLATSAHRVVSSLAVFGAVLFPLLVSEAMANASARRSPFEAGR